VGRHTASIQASEAKGTPEDARLTEKDYFLKMKEGLADFQTCLEGGAQARRGPGEDQHRLCQGMREAWEETQEGQKENVHAKRKEGSLKKKEGNPESVYHGADLAAPP